MEKNNLQLLLVIKIASVKFSVNLQFLLKLHTSENIIYFALLEYIECYEISVSKLKGQRFYSRYVLIR